MKRFNFKKMIPFILSGIIFIFLSSALWSQTLEIHYINVQQGQSVLIIGTDGTTVLCDGGDVGKGNSEVIPYLQGLGITYLDYVVLTHRDADHYEGLTEVMNYPIDALNVYDNGSDKYSTDIQDFLDAAAGTSAGGVTTMTLGTVINLGSGCKATCVAVDGSVTGVGPIPGAQNNENDRSICLLVEYGNFDYLLTGDAGGGDDDNGCTGRSTTQVNIETPLVQAIMPGGCNPMLSSYGAEVAHVGHHGSESSCNSDYMNLLTPSVACISVGAGQGWNWHHPRIDVVEKVLLAQVYCITAPPVELVLQTEEGQPVGTNTSYAGYCVGDIVITTNGIKNYTINASGAVSQGPDERIDAGLPVTYGFDEPAIFVNYPDGGDYLEVGSDQWIMWDHTGPVGNVKIEYSSNNGSNWTVIVASTENDGCYLWTIPDDVSDLCLVRVSETDGDPSDTSDAVFSIVPVPVITVTSPNGCGELWEVGSCHNVTWTHAGFVGNVKIEYSNNNGAGWNVIVESTENDGCYEWTIPNDVSDLCLVRISDIEGEPSDTSDAVFSIVPVPTITITSPNGGEYWQVASTYNITWTSDEGAGSLIKNFHASDKGINLAGNIISAGGTMSIDNVKIEYSIDNGENWIVIVESTENDGCYEWTIPNTVSAQCLVRISDLDGIPTDTSDAVFSIVPIPVITVTSPDGGEEWETASIQNVTWIHEGLIDNVKIEYSNNNGAGWIEIIASTVNDGCFEWTIPDDVSDLCLIRISDIDGDPSDTSNAVFSIVPAPTIIVTSPNGGENWEVGSFHNITWTSEGAVGDVNIHYSINGGDSWLEIVQFTENDGCYEWTIPDTPSSNCIVLVREVDSDAGPWDVSDAVFSIVAQSITGITVTSPNGGETWAVNSAYDITWTSNGIEGGARIEYSTDRGISWVDIIMNTENDGVYQWTLPDTPSENCLVRISCGDGDDGHSDMSNGPFSIVPPAPPAIVVTSPNGGEQLLIGLEYEITWTTYGNVDEVNLEYSTDNGDTWETIAEYVPNIDSYLWIVSAPQSENCLIRVSEIDGEPFDVSNEVFAIVPVPTITVTSPNGGETLEADSSHNITWNSTGSLDCIRIEYSQDSGDTWTIIVDSAPNNGSYQWNVPDTQSDFCLIKISSCDMDRNPEDVSDDVFSIMPLL